MGWPCLLAILLLVGGSSPARAEVQLKPFVAMTFGGKTTYIDLEHAAGDTNVAFGASATVIGDMVGLEADFGQTPGFFQSGSQRLLLKSSATTLTGNLVVALPRRLTEYTLRPYVVGGAGFMRVHIADLLGVLAVANNLPAFDVGAGVTGFLTGRLGVGWDVRYFHSLGGDTGTRGVSFGAEQLAFWRANMALVIRY